MNELKEKLTALGLDENMAQQAIDAVIGFVKDKLPENMQGLVDGALNGETPDLEESIDKVKGFFS